MGATAGSEFPAGFVDAVAAFNRGEFFDAHEGFEELLDAVESDERWDLLVALIQVAVGYHKGVSGHAGCERMLRLGSEKLATFADDAWGVEVGRLRDRVAADLAADAEGDSVPARVLADPPQLRLLAGRSL